MATGSSPAKTRRRPTGRPPANPSAPEIPRLEQFGRCRNLVGSGGGLQERVPSLDRAALARGRGASDRGRTTRCLLEIFGSPPKSAPVRRRAAVLEVGRGFVKDGDHVSAGCELRFGLCIGDTDQRVDGHLRRDPHCVGTYGLDDRTSGRRYWPRRPCAILGATVLGCRSPRTRRSPSRGRLRGRCWCAGLLGGYPRAEATGRQSPSWGHARAQEPPRLRLGGSPEPDACRPPCHSARMDVWLRQPLHHPRSPYQSSSGGSPDLAD